MLWSQGKNFAWPHPPFNPFSASQAFHYQLKNVAKISTTVLSSGAGVIIHSLCKLNLKF